MPGHRPARTQAGGTAGDLQALAALGDPARRALYGYVAGQGRPVSRDEAADATGLKRPTAAFHLERLVSDGLLEARFARLTGRTGPGAGRTAKLYTRSCRQIDVSLPPRRYEIAADVLAGALEAARCRQMPAGQALAEVATEAGRRMAARGGDLPALLTEAGYEPRPAGGGGLHLANCPFHDLIARHTDLVCEMNLYLLRGLTGELAEPVTARLDPAAGRCCVVLVPR